MPKPPKAVEERIETFIKAWTTLRADKSFSGLTLEQFTAKVQKSLDAREKIGTLEKQIQAAINDRDDADKASSQTMKRVVNSVKGDPNEGEDSPLLEALGYVRESNRKKGGRRRSAPQTVLKAA